MEKTDFLKIIKKEGKNNNLIISDNEWEKIENYITKPEKKFNKEDLKEFIGCINLKTDPMKFQESMREEWN